MMDVQVTFEDGTTELRPANCPAIEIDSPLQRHVPSDFVFADVHPARPDYVVFFGLRQPGSSTHAVSAWREGDCLVWCLTGQDQTTGALSGEWRRCYVESAHEQVERLTRERDAARRMLGEVAKTLARAVGLLNDQRPVLRRLEQHAKNEIDWFEAGVAEETIDMVIEELRAALAAAKGAST